MNTRSLILATLLVVAFAAVAFAQTEEEAAVVVEEATVVEETTVTMEKSEWSTSFNVDIATAYASRGNIFYNGIAIQPALDFANGNFYFGFWGSLHTGLEAFSIQSEIEQSPGGAEFNELDVYAGYGAGVGPVYLNIGGALFTYPTGGIFDSLDAEIAVSVSGSIVEEGPFSIGWGFTLKQAVSSSGGDYGQWVVDLGAGWAVTDALSLGFSISPGINTSVSTGPAYVDSFGLPISLSFSKSFDTFSVGGSVNGSIFQRFNEVDLDNDTVLDDESLDLVPEIWLVLSFGV